MRARPRVRSLEACSRAAVGGGEEFRRVGAPGAAQDKHNLWANTVLSFGTDALKEAFVRRLLVDDVKMCLLYSEPGAGSDVASLATKAVRDGDEWIVNGQKVWTTLAHLAAVTERMTLGPLVAGITHRNVAHLGKIVATLDVLSGGRAVCGLGLGWFEEEHRAYGLPFPPRSERYALLERLAARIAEVCAVDTRVHRVAVTVRKLHPPVRAMVDHVAVSIDREVPGR